jgi:GTPase KRas
MREHYMREGEGFLLVYSITERDSFDLIGAFHQQLVRVKDMDSIPVVLVGNKCDLEYERRVEIQGVSSCYSSFLILDHDSRRRRSVHLFIIPSVQTTEGHHIARELGCRFVETSAKLGTNVSETFMDLVRQIRDHNRVRLKAFFFLFE